MNRIQVVTITLITVAALLSSGHGLAQASPPCADDLASCPDRGCADPETDDALVNQAKRRTPPADAPIRLTLDDFDRLQGQANQLVGQKVSLDQAARNRLRDLKLKSSDRRVAEGDLVEVTGFLTGLPHRP